ncbi:hypothetical protein [Fredinandcohnia onubensis]|nr:hypothetical protein [Fredinandcohnia onubensis]
MQHKDRVIIIGPFIKVMNLKRPMTILMKPSIVFAVLKNGLTKKRRL